MEEINKESKTEGKELTISHVPPLHQPYYPWLMLCEPKQEKYQVFYSITENHLHVRSIPELHGNDFITCSNNKRWLVYQDNSTKQCFILNISTMEKLSLPSVIQLLCYPWIVLSSPTMDGTCRVILFDQYPDRFLSCNLGDTEFIDRPVAFEGGANDPFSGVINFNRSLYALTLSYNLIVADYADPYLLFKPIIRGEALDKLLPSHCETKNYLVESCGDVLFVYTRSRDCELTDIQIFRANFTRGEWARVERLGDRALFLDAHHCFSSPASKFGLRGNRVYFVNEFGRNLFVFDLEDESISMSLPCSIAKSTSSLFWMSISDD